MQDTRDDEPLTGLELIVLARLSSKPPKQRDLTDAVLSFAPPEGLSKPADDVVEDALDALRRRGLVAPGNRMRTAEGNRVLRAMFGVEQITWIKLRDAIPALALGLRPGSDEAHRALRNEETIAAALLRADFGIAAAPNLAAFGDALIAKAVGLPPGPVTLARLRAHLLARQMGGELKGASLDLVALVAENTVGKPLRNKKSLGPALASRWLYRTLPATRARAS